jgi:glycosyltransferase involved in cell wall biosynthesis
MVAMEPEQLEHLDRIGALLDALKSISWLDDEEIEPIAEQLLGFDGTYWSFLRILSLPLYRELTGLLASGSALPYLRERPRIAVVVPVYQAQRDLLSAGLGSLRQQVGVAIDCLISVDGREEDRLLVEEVLAELGAAEESSHWKVSVFMLERNRGVGMCRNRALRELTAPFFTCLDADDIFHPLRCLHAYLVLQISGVARVNTGWSRVSIRQGKIVMINGLISTHGHNSFIARSEILQKYGYFSDLRVHEDTEYMQRFRYFNEPMLDSAIVSHFLNSEVGPEYKSLSTPLRHEVIPIDNHPYLCGTVIASANQERLKIERYHKTLYNQLISTALLKAFPAD